MDVTVEVGLILFVIHIPATKTAATMQQRADRLLGDAAKGAP